MNPPNRPTTSWVQMSATGNTPLAGHPAFRRPQTTPTTTTTTTTNTTASAGGSNSTTAPTHNTTTPAYASQQQQQQDQAATCCSYVDHQPLARLSFVSSTSSSSTSTSTSTATTATTSHHSQTSGPSSTPASGPTSGSQPGSLVSSSSASGPAAAATSQQESGAGAGPRALGFVASAANQQLQAAMGELQLAEQQLFGLTSGFLGGGGADQLNDQQQEETRKLRLQLYVFVLRCISYPFNAKQTATGDHRQQLLKLRKQQFEQIVQAHTKFIRSATTSQVTSSSSSGAPNGSSTTTTTNASNSASFRCQYQHLRLSQAQVRQLDELHERAQRQFNKRFLHNEKLRLLVDSECCSQQDLRDLFRQNGAKILDESAMFVAARQLQQRASQQQQQHQRQSTMIMSGQQQQQRQQRATPEPSGGPSGGPSSAYQAEVGQQLQLGQQLLANREAILNIWLIKFESIIRDGDPMDGGAASASPAATINGNTTLGSPLDSTPSSVSCPATDNAPTTSPPPPPPPLGAHPNATTTTAPIQQQQLTKEQLYQMFQNILSIKKFEHQLLYNALQLESSDEQAAAIRRELDGRVARVAELERNKKLLPKFVLKEMESMYLEELRRSVNQLMVNLDRLPVSRGGSSDSPRGFGLGGVGGGGGSSSGGGGGAASSVYSGLQRFRRYNSRSQQRGYGAAQTTKTSPGDHQPAPGDLLGSREGPKRLSSPNKQRARVRASQFCAKLSSSSTAVRGAGARGGGGGAGGLQLSPEFRRQHPAASFLVKRAQMPLWNLTYQSLSGFGKIAAQASLNRDTLAESHPGEPQLSKLDVLLTFNIEVIVMEVRGLRHLAPTREIYCTMEIEGSETGRLQTEHVQARKPLWDTQGDFTTSHPLPILKIKLYAVNPSMLSLEDKELGKLVLRPTVLSPKTPEWCTMVASSSSFNSSGSGSNSGSGGGLGGGGSSSSGGSGAGEKAGAADSGPSNELLSATNEQSSAGAGAADELKIRVIVRMDRPQQLKHCGFLYGVGKSTWRKFKRRYHILIQVSQYTFVMCAYREKKAKPTEMLPLDGYTVDYIEPPTDLIMDHCSEVVSSQDFACGSGGGGGGVGAGLMSSSRGTFGLAGRLAKPFLKQQQQQQQNDDFSAGHQYDTTSAAGLCVGASGEHQQQQPQSAIQTAAALSDELHNKFYFNVVKEGDSVVFGCDDEQECFGWVMALYRATGQAHKPTPLRSQYASSRSHYLDAAFAYSCSSLAAQSGGPAAAGAAATTATSSSTPGGGGGGGLIKSMLNGVKGHGARGAAVAAAGHVDQADQRARKHGMDEFIGADPCRFQHQPLFKYLQEETLRYRLQEAHCSLGWLSAGQLYVLDEYCARYGVRTCYRHLAYLNSLLDFNHQRGYFIDHTLLNYGYDFCSSFVSGQMGAGPMSRPPMSSVNFDLREDGIGTVTVEERELFHVVRTKLLKMLERQLANFAHCFPFGKPDGSLRAALSLLERVLMKEQQTSSMLQNDEVRNLIRKCLEQAALSNYTRLSSEADLRPPGPPSGPGNSSLLQDQPGQAAEDPGLLGGGGGGRKRTQSNLSGASLQSQQSSSSSAASASGSASFRSTRNDHHQQQQQPCLTMTMIINNEHMRAHDKLRYLIRLAELCCELVEENNEYFGDAFAWHSDLMMDHFELFWSLFSVDMDKILAEFSQQQVDGGSGGAPLPLAPAIGPAGTSAAAPTTSGGPHDLFQAQTRDAFRLFQVLNNHMRRGPSFNYSRFRAHLCAAYKPRLLRYIDIMESTLTRSLLKACERDGQVNGPLLEGLFQRLEELQQFVVNQLRWPDEQLAEQLQQRLKLMAYELCDASVQRTLLAFQQWERKSNKWTATTTSYSSPVEMIQMINLTLDTRSRSLKLCTFQGGFDQMSYHSKIDKLVEAALGEMQPGLMGKMLNALDSTLTKLARYDEGNLLAPILSLTYKQGMSSSGKDIGKQYVAFVSNCCDLLRHKINDELWIVTLLEDWYAAQMGTICNWLAERIDRSLHDVQLTALANIMPKVYADMALQGVPEEKLNLKSYQTIVSRLKMEEAAALAGGSLFDQQTSASNSNSNSNSGLGGGGGSSIFNTSILSSLTSSAASASSSSSISTAATTTMGNNSGASAALAGCANTTPAAGHQSMNSPPVASSLANPLRQTLSNTRQATGPQHHQQQVASNTGRRFGSIHGQSPPVALADASNTTASQQQDDAGDNNLADRALQSATRMFKGFWAN